MEVLETWAGPRVWGLVVLGWDDGSVRVRPPSCSTAGSVAGRAVVCRRLERRPTGRR